MKFAAILMGFAAFVTAMEQEVFKVPVNKLVNIQKVSTQCAEEHNVNPGLVSKVADGTIPEDETSVKYMYCFALKLGVLTEDGHFIVEKMANILGEHPLAEKFKEAINKCNNITKDNILATVFAMNRCYINTVPVRFQV